MSTEPLLYGELAPWWPLLSAPEEYIEEAEHYTAVLRARAPGVRTVLELGSGGGNNASYLKRHFELTLVDRSEPMLAVSRRLNPECEHRLGDMRTVRLGRTFDAVFVHDAVAYLTALDDLRALAETLAAHCAPGGIVLLAPDEVTETFVPWTDHGGHDSADGARGLRYLAWSFDPDPSDTEVTVDYAYLLRDGDDVSVVHDRHVTGLFPRQTWIDVLRDGGFVDVEIVPGPPDDRPRPETTELFVARRPAG